jgi:hypothetical protein
MLDKMMDTEGQLKKMIQFKFQLHTFYDMRAIHKVNSSELLTKQATRPKKLIVYKKNTYSHISLLSVCHIARSRRHRNMAPFTSLFTFKLSLPCQTAVRPTGKV